MPPTRKRTPPKPAPVRALPPPAAKSLDQVLELDTLLDVLDAAAGEMSWLKASDAALLELCRRYARAIDDAVSISKAWGDISGDFWELAEATESKVLLKRAAAIEKAADVGKQVAWIGPLLANALRDLGGSPGERKGLEADAPVKSRLQQLREEKQANQAGAGRRSTTSK